MSETQMPAVEATLSNEPELMNYEFAFHILPTVAEGEVPGVFESIKAQITKAGGKISAEEAPLRFDLAYEIVKYLEGKNRKFGSAYFGWVRFNLSPAALNELTEEIDGKKELLRYLFIKLTKIEEANEFRFHDSIAHRKVQTIDEEVAEVEEETVDETNDEVVADEEIEEVEEVEGEDDGAKSK